MSNMTLTDVEEWISKYPDLWDVYCEVRSKLYSYYQDTLSTEFQLLSEITLTFWKMAEEHWKLENDETK